MKTNKNEFPICHILYIYSFWLCDSKQMERKRRKNRDTHHRWKSWSLIGFKSLQRRDKIEKTNEQKNIFINETMLDESKIKTFQRIVTFVGCYNKTIDDGSAFGIIIRCNCVIVIEKSQMLEWVVNCRIK